MDLLAPLHDRCPDPKRKLHDDEFCATDRGYFCFDLMAEILNAGSSFVDPVRDNVVYETIEEPRSARATGRRAFARTASCARVGNPKTIRSNNR
ncbi:hypothetical protein HQ520_07465 [bacterium]|nr:hypothetical protein [bacterium]